MSKQNTTKDLPNEDQIRNNEYVNEEKGTTAVDEQQEQQDIEEIVFPSTTIVDAFHEMKRFRVWSDATLKSYILDIQHYTSFCYKIKQEPVLSTARMHLVNQWINSQKEEGFSVSTINRRVASLSSLYKFYKELGTVSSNPFKIAEVPVGLKGHHSRDLEIDDLFKVHRSLETMKADGYEVDVTVRVMLLTGLRNSALTKLKVKDVNFEQGIIHYDVGIINSKHKIQVFPIPPILLGKLREHIRENHLHLEDPLLNGLKGDPLRAKQLNRITDKICEYLDWEGDLHITPHGFRASIATILDERDVSRDTIKFLLGHSDQMENIDYYLRRHKKKLRRLRHELTVLEQEIEEGVKTLKEEGKKEGPYQKKTLHEVDEKNEVISGMNENTSNKISQEEFLELLEVNKTAAMALFKQNLVAIQE